MKKIKHITLMLFSTLFLLACEKYLDVKPNKSLAIPGSIKDFLAIIDGQEMSYNYPNNGNDASDDHFLLPDRYNALALIEPRLNYVWDATAENEIAWSSAYRVVMNANVVLERIDNVTGVPQPDVDNARGCALFFRAHAFYHIAQVFAPIYDRAIASEPYGIPLRLKADATEQTTRSTIERTYQQIIADYKAAGGLLPVTPLVKTRPSKAAAYSALARVYLVMGEYELANRYADTALLLFPNLIDYNEHDLTANVPFEMFNKEVIFHSSSSGRGGIFSPSNARVDTNLLALYEDGDLRRVGFFQETNDGYHMFKGSYAGTYMFNGFSAAELLLTRAETAARLGNIKEAVDDLNTLLSNRISRAFFQPVAEDLSSEEVLDRVLAERRKELAFRGTRWNDLRRLNKEDRFAKTLTRKLGDEIFTLPPHDLRYTFLIPWSVIELSGIMQNER